MACTREKNPGQEEVLATAIQLNINEITLEKGSSETLTVNYVPAASAAEPLPEGWGNLEQVSRFGNKKGPAYTAGLFACP